MADNELDRIRERIEQNRRYGFRDRSALAENAAGAECRMGCTFLAGDRVLDLITGFDGVVETVARDNVVGAVTNSPHSAAGGSLTGLPTSEILETVSVRLNDARLVTRRVRELVKRPTPPGAK